MQLSCRGTEEGSATSVLAPVSGVSEISICVYIGISVLVKLSPVYKLNFTFVFYLALLHLLQHQSLMYDLSSSHISNDRWGTLVV